MNYHFRPAVNADRDTVEGLVFGVLAEYGLSPDPSGTDSDLHDILSAYTSSGGAFDLLVDDSGRVVGSVGLFRVSVSTCELRKMYLLRSVRGQGLGQRMLQHALLRAEQLSFTRVVLETASVLREAVALYEKYGFRPYEAEHLAPRCDVAYCLQLPRTKGR